MRTLILPIVFLVAAVFSYAQSPLATPSDLTLKFETENQQHEFRIGELIPVTFAYSSTTPGKYSQVNLYKKLSGGAPLEILCNPPAEPVRKPAACSQDPMQDRFSKILHARCHGPGVGYGCGGGCLDCDVEHPLGPGGLHFGYPLNLEVRFRKPGTYSCVASSSDVTASPIGETIRPAVLLKSDPLVLKIVDDANWANGAAQEYGRAFEKRCPQVDLEFKQQSQCWDLARRITFLETPAALEIEVRGFTGKSEKWGTGFWEAIQETPHRADALRLLTTRMQEPDFQATPYLMELMSMWNLQLDSPDAFGAGSPLAYNSQALDLLRRYVRLLGSSLATKQGSVLAENVKTYRRFAESEFCDEASLISPEERAQVLAALNLSSEESY